MAAASLPSSLSVLIIDANKTLGKKLSISGGGKCNFTNRFMSPSFYRADENFILPSLNSFSYNDSLDFFKDIETEERDKGKIFGSKSSKMFRDRLIFEARKCEVALNIFIKSASFEDGLFALKSEQKIFKCKRLIVSLGSPAWPQVGTSDKGWEIAQKFGHSIISPSPALAPLTLQLEQFWMKGLSGISFDVKATISEKILKDSLLFSHKGLSGPLALDISLFWEKGVIEFDFWPSGCLEKILESKSKKQISSLISLPKRFIKAFLEAEKIEDKTINLLTKEEKNSLKKLHKYIFAPAGTLGLAKAEVVKGGVDTKEVDSLTLESRCQKNLYFIGEVLNVTGALGGYNLHWAFASARQCTKHLT